MRKLLLSILILVVGSCATTAPVQVEGLIADKEVEGIYRSVVLIRSDISAGSGSLIAGGYILSAAHVCQSNRTMFIPKYNVHAAVVLTDPTRDMCLLKLPDSVIPNLGAPIPVSSAPSSYFRPSVAVGYPSLVYWVSDMGFLLPEETNLNTNTVITTILSIAPGISGGPILQRNPSTGTLEISGVIVGMALTNRREGVVVPLPAVREFLEAARKAGVYNVN